jgi:CubicO group peptidase (beta-lactamase class C family)
MSLDATSAAAARESDLQQRVRATIDRAIAEQRLVGAVVLVARDGRIVYRGAAGEADRDLHRPMREDAIFRYASLTKPIVSAAAMVMIERGTIALDDEVTKWLPAFRPRTADGDEPRITIKHLLTHTAGLTYGLMQKADGPYHRAGISDGLDQPGLSMDEELRRIASVPLSNVPGTSWGYSVAMDVLGAVLARADGTSLPHIVEKLVTAPLHMTDTAFTVRDPARLVTPYLDSGTPGTPPRRMSDPDEVVDAQGWVTRYAPSRIFEPRSYPSAGVGMAGTASDFMTFLETLRTGGSPILKPETVEAMRSNQIGELRVNAEPTPAWGFGFGGAVLLDPELAGVPQAKGTWKWGGVYGNHWYMDPEHRLSVVALTNTAVEGMSGAFVEQLRGAVYGVS